MMSNHLFLSNISDTNDGGEHVAQIRRQSDLASHAQLNHFHMYLTSIPGITCTTSHTRLSPLSASNIGSGLGMWLILAVVLYSLPQSAHYIMFSGSILQARTKVTHHMDVLRR